MLPTLNLQLLPVEIPDESLRTSASLMPGGDPEAPVDFADLLRLRADESVLLPTDAGELLPDTGSELPLEPEFFSAQVSKSPTDPTGAALPLTQLGQILSGAEPPAVSAEPLTRAVIESTDVGNADISLEAVIAYPPTAPNEVVATAATELPGTTALPSTIAVPSAIGDDELMAPLETRSQQLPERPLRPEVPGRPMVTPSIDKLPQIPLTAAAPERQTTNAAQLATATQADRNTPLPELPLRPAVAASADRGDAVAHEMAPLLRARPVVAQPAQALHAQLNLQQPPNLFATPAPSAVSSDTSFAAAAQQATDLISTSVRDSIWGERVGDRVVMMATNQMKSAEIRLTPAELGPLRVQVAIDDGAANVTFHAQHAVTRDALEQALPRLREMLAENGLALGNAEVGDDGVRQGSRDTESDAAMPAGSGDESVDGAVDQGLAAERPAAVLRGLVDTFA